MCIEFGPVRDDSVRRGPPWIKSPLRRFTPSWTSTRVTCDCLLPFVHPLLSHVLSSLFLGAGLFRCPLLATLFALAKMYESGKLGLCNESQALSKECSLLEASQDQIPSSCIFSISSHLISILVLVCCETSVRSFLPDSYGPFVQPPASGCRFLCVSGMRSRLIAATKVRGSGPKERTSR